MQPGMFLSHPPIATTPSKPSAPTTVSTLSAMTSRETSEYFMPSVPIDMPSDTVGDPNMMPFPPDASTPLTTSWASLSMCILHGVSMLQVETTPTCGFLKSSSLKPTALSIALLGARSSPSTTAEEYCLFVSGFDMFMFLYSVRG